MATENTILNELPNKSQWTLIKTAAQAFTTSWVDVGSLFNAKGSRGIAIKFDYDVNNTVDAQLRVTSELTETGTEDVKNAIYSPEADKVKIKPCVIEIDYDADEKYVVEFPVSLALDWAQLQIYAAVPGTPAGTVAKVYYRLLG